MKCRKCKQVRHTEEECEGYCTCDQTLDFALCLKCQERFFDFLEHVEQYTFTVGDLLEYDDESVN